ncbi:MAG: hypothetical protein ABI703_08870 [Gemmatimonadales bacterium]
MQRLVLILFAGIGMLGCNDSGPTSPTALSPQYAKGGGGGTVSGITVTSIGPTTGSSAAEEVNDQGLIVLNAGSPSRAFLWTPSQPRGTSGTLQDLGTVGGSASQATAINNSGHVVGSTGIGPFLWTQTGGMQGLGLASGWTSAAPQDINDAGDVAGTGGIGGANQAVVWHVSVDGAGLVQVAGRESLGIPPGWESSAGFAVNNLGQVAGWISTAAGPNHAALWTPSPEGWIIEDLGLLPGDYGSGAYGINDQGQVVGWSRPQQGCIHATLWSTQGGKLVSARALETQGGCSAEAWAVNNQGQIVGRLTLKSGQNATMWSLAPDGSTASIKDLGRLSGTGGSLGVGLSSNVGGVTEVAGFSQGTTQRATLWTVR